MGLIREPLEVDFFFDPKPLTKKEQQMISDFIKRHIYTTKSIKHWDIAFYPTISALSSFVSDEIDGATKWRYLNNPQCQLGVCLSKIFSPERA